MEYSISNASGSNIVSFRGKITFSDHQAFKALIVEMEKTPKTPIILNLSGVEYIDSAGLGMFLLLRDRLGSVVPSIAISQANGVVRKVLTLSNFEKLFVMKD